MHVFMCDFIIIGFLSFFSCYSSIRYLAAPFSALNDKKILVLQVIDGGLPMLFSYRHVSCSLASTGYMVGLMMTTVLFS